jgi:DNA-directed RNA polymerase specialized sigma24 family protein
LLAEDNGGGSNSNKGVFEMSGRDTAGLRGFARALSQTERYVLMPFYAEELTPTETGLVLELPESEVLAILDRVRGHARAFLRRRKPAAAGGILPTGA